MSDIDPRDCADGLADTGQNMIESPRQQLAERSREIDNLKQQVVYYINKSETDYDKFTESQAEAERYKAAWESSHNQAMQNGQAALESQAREKVLRDAMSTVIGNCILGIHNGRPAYHITPNAFEAMVDALALPANSTALDSAIKQAKREALLEAADYANTIDSPLSHAALCRMAVEIK